MRKRPVGLIILVSAFIFGSVAVTTIFVRNWVVVFSGRTELIGEIAVDRRSLHVGDTIELELIVPDRYAHLNRLTWEVVPPEAGDIIYNRVTPEDKNQVDRRKYSYPDHDRSAALTLAEPGLCLIRVTGYLKKG